MQLSRTFQIIIGLLGLTMVILIHELGHLIAAKLCNIPVTLFSIGFGPALVALKIGTTIYQIALLPIGGYVAIDQSVLDAQPYSIKAFVVLAGIAANLLFTFIIFCILRIRNIKVSQLGTAMSARFKNQVMGPIGIIALISYSATLGPAYFLAILGVLSFSIGLFNLLPIPFFDGGQLAWYTIETITGPLPESAFNIITSIFIGFFLLFLLYISIKDVRSLR